MTKEQHSANSNPAPEFEVLDLELYPGPVQVMPPVSKPPRFPLALRVCGNVLIGVLLLSGLLLFPAFITSLMATF